MESSSNLLLTDLAAITIAAAVSMRLFSFLKLPQLLGFIFTGMVLSPVLHVIEDSAAIRELGELGVMFMMFIVLSYIIWISPTHGGPPGFGLDL